VILQRSRKLPEALEAMRSARTVFLETGDIWAALHAHSLEAEIEEDLGDLSASRNDYEQVIAQQRARGDVNLGRSLLRLAEVEIRQAAYGAARGSIEAAQVLPASEKYSPPLDLALLARIAFEEKKYAEAETLTRKALALQDTFERPDEAAGVGATLSSTLLARGKTANARTAAQEAAVLIKPDSDFYPRVALAEARASGAAHLDESIAIEPTTRSMTCWRRSSPSARWRSRAIDRLRERI
jgi:tetratricopeptide (TPR) repeat protein